MHPTLIPSFRTGRLLAALLGVAAVAACIDWNRSTETEIVDIRRYVFSVSTLAGVEADFVPGVAPASTDGASVTANIPAIVLKGGTAKVTFTSQTEFSRIVIAVDGVDGYFDLSLDAPTKSADVLIVYAQDVGAPAFWLQYAAGSGAGIGAFSASNTAFLGNATGPVQVNVTWDSKADVDLYVVDPRGNEIYYNARGPLQGAGSPPTSSDQPPQTGTTTTTPAFPTNGTSGGVLDVDSNAGCVGDGPRAENIVWPTRVVPPRGEYVVRVNYWSSCGVEGTDYVVTIRIKGGEPVTYTGHLSGAGVGGASGAGKRIASFVY